MREAWILTSRTIKLYLKNPLALLFSFVYMLLFIVLISMFLGDYLADGMKEVYQEVNGMNFSQLRWLVDGTAMAGVLMINCILVPLNVLAVMVQDKNDNRLDSFLVSAVSRDKLVLGYWLTPFIAGIIMNLIGLFVSQCFIVINGGEWLSLQNTVKMAGLMAVNTFSSASILFVVALLMKSASLYNTITGIVSALVGFVTGAFLPIGVFPDSIQKLFAVIPAHYGLTMMRAVMTQDSLHAVFRTVQDQTVKGTFLTSPQITDIYAAENGIVYLFGDKPVAFPVMLGIVIGSGFIFLGLSVVFMKRYQKS